MVIAIDFDGTCTTHDFPKVGKEIGAEDVLRKLVLKGHKLVLFTMRSGDTQAEAVGWFKDRKIPLYGVQKNPTQWKWTKSPKAYAELYIDDAALGCPLIVDETVSNRSFVNWKEVEKLLKIKNIL